LRLAISRCISTAQRNAPTTLPNSMSNPSVAGGFDQTAAVFCDFRIEELAAAAL